MSKKSSKAIVPIGATPTVRDLLRDLKSRLPSSLAMPDNPSEALTIEADAIGQHPEAVIRAAHSVLVSTARFAPVPAEIIEAILAAYDQLGIEYSPDALRHLSYRKPVSRRYYVNADGRRWFHDDARIIGIGYVHITGAHGNLVVRDVPETDARGVDEAFVKISSNRCWKPGLRSESEATVAYVLDHARREARRAACYAKFGPPETLCGGPVFEGLTSTFVALSRAAVDAALEGLTYCTVEDAHPVFRELTTWFGEAGATSPENDRLNRAVGYGTTLQAEFEALFREAMKKREAFYEAERAAAKIN